MSFLTKIFSKGAKDLIETGGKVIDNISTSDEEKMKAKNELTATVFKVLSHL